MENKTKNFNDIINGDQPVLVDFFASWCGPCKMMEPVLEEVAVAAGKKARVVKVDVDKNPMAANKYSVRGVPTLMLFHKGKVLWRQSGIVQAREILSKIDSYTAAAP
jgi:thioredoxin 1